MKKGKVGKPAKQNNTAVYDSTIKTLGEETLEVLFTLRFPNLKPVRVQALNPEFKDVVWRTGDLLFEVECANGSVWVVHIEAESRNQKTINRRMFRYCGEVWEKYKRPPLQFVLYLGEARCTIKTVTRFFGTTFRFRLINLREISAETLLAMGSPMSYLLAPLGRTENPTEVLDRVLYKLLSYEADEAKKHLNCLINLSGLRKLSGLTEKINTRLAQMKNIKTEPIMTLPVFREIKEENLRIGRRQGLQKGLQKGREAGIQEGIEKGKKERDIEIALNLEAQGNSLSQIAATLGLTTAEVQQLLTQ